MRMRMLCAAVLVFIFVGSDRARAATVVATLGDASIAHDSAAGTWTIGAGGAVLSLGLDASRDFQVVSLRSPSGQSWILGAVSDTTIMVNGASGAFGRQADGFEYKDATSSSTGHTLRLDATFVLRSAALQVTRHFAVTSGSPTFEVWTTFEPLGGSVTLSNLNAFRLTTPDGTIHWLNGLQGDNANTTDDDAFTLQQQELGVGGHLVLGAQGRSSEQTVPWIAIDGAQDEFYAGLMWSGAWSLTIDRIPSGLQMTLGLPSMMTTVQGRIEGPHALFGVIAGGLPEASAALRSFLLEALRAGRPLTPLVTYNTWFAYGIRTDESSMRDEMDRAAALGAELFVLDAGWHVGAGASDDSDFESGLGTWEVDPSRFPNGLKPLTDHAHALGMKFGIWVEPERVDLHTVRQPGLVREQWLAQRGGAYESNDTAQVCLASAAARQWLLDRLTALIDAVQPDYIKWDNNTWMNCDRAGHGHGATDGNFSHVDGLYQLLAALRERYPDLLIENVSGGGNRLDFGMLRYTDVAWMDDRTAPSVHVRHNIEGLGAAFPPAYLLSFVVNHNTEPLHDAPDLSLYFRSRMAGALGLCFLSEDLSESDAAEISHEIAIYKNVRATLRQAAAALLTPQAAMDNGPEWDVLQASAPGGDAILLYVYQSYKGSNKINVRPFNLQPRATYVVASVDVGILGTATGAALMDYGIDVIQGPNSAGHILTLVAGR